MGLILADVGADVILKCFFNNSRAAGGNNLTIKLYVNDYTPLDTSVAGDFTEAADGGYGSKTLTCGSWTVTVGNDPSDAVYAQQTWTFTGPLNGSATIYGYWVVDADGVLVYGERLTTSFQPVNNGDLLKITPQFQMSKGTPA
jgi:hypothetical protein